MIQSPDVKGSERWFPTPSGKGKEVLQPEAGS
jgi:hypothetical protein